MKGRALTLRPHPAFRAHSPRKEKKRACLILYASPFPRRSGLKDRQDDSPVEPSSAPGRPPFRRAPKTWIAGWSRTGRGETTPSHDAGAIERQTMACVWRRTPD